MSLWKKGRKIGVGVSVCVCDTTNNRIYIYIRKKTYRFKSRKKGIGLENIGKFSSEPMM